MVVKKSAKLSKKSSTKSEEKSQAAEAKRTELRQALVRERLGVLQEVLKFKQFLGSSFEPIISDSEIIVCFADIRGFTAYCRNLQKEMQDRKIQNFLRTYIRIFNEGLMKWFVENLDEEYGRIQDDLKAEFKEISKFVIPTMYKNLGDGMMIVWEIPSSLDLNTQGGVAQEVIEIIQNIGESFYWHFRNLTPVELDAYSEEVTQLDIGFGVTKGHAWRLDFGNSVDYAGSIINLASRLESLARPGGIIASYDVSNWLFDYFVNDAKKGHIVKLEQIKGYGSDVIAWVDAQVNSKQAGFNVLR